MRVSNVMQLVMRLRPKLTLKFNYPFRVKLGAGLIVLVALLSNLGQFLKDWKEFDPSQIGNDGITIFVKRYDRLRTMLPANGVVGYVTDSEAYNIEFYLTQYALAPLIVDPKQPHELVVGSFANRTSTPKTAADANLVLQMDFGNGLKLFSLGSR